MVVSREYSCKQLALPGGYSGQYSTHGCISQSGDRLFVFTMDLLTDRTRDMRLTIYDVVYSDNGRPIQFVLAKKIAFNSEKNSGLYFGRHATFTTISDSCVISYGGYMPKTPHEFEYGSNLYQLDLETFEWTRIDCLNPLESPGPRAGHAAWCIDSKFVFISAGCGAMGVSNDLWVFDLTLRTWKMVDEARGGPVKTLHSASMNRLGRDGFYRLTLIGGRGTRGVSTAVLQYVGNRWDIQSWVHEGSVFGMEPHCFNSVYLGPKAGHFAIRSNFPLDSDFGGTESEAPEITRLSDGMEVHRYTSHSIVHFPDPIVISHSIGSVSGQIPGKPLWNVSNWGGWITSTAPGDPITSKQVGSYARIV